MHKEINIVVLMNNDTQILKGLMLMLEDMQFTVVPASQNNELETLLKNLSQRPSLLLLPFEVDGYTSGLELVRHIRTFFQHPVPTILLSRDNELDADRYIDEHIFVLSEHTPPKQLRKAILGIKDDEMVI